MGIIKDLKNKRIMSEINRLNNNMLEGNFRASGVYKGNIYSFGFQILSLF